MPSKTGLAFKFLQWFVRGVQFCCSALILVIFAYFLAVIHQTGFNSPYWIRAVVGISGLATIYTLIGLLLLCCLAGYPLTSGLAILLDIAFAGAFIYVAVVNRDGANDCSNLASRPGGTDYQNLDEIERLLEQGTDQNDAIPGLDVICRLQKAVLTVAIVAIIFFVLSALIEFILIRIRRKDNRYGPSPANNYTSGYGSRRGGLFSRRRHRKPIEPADQENALPMHTQPNHLSPTSPTATSGDAAFAKHGESGYAPAPPTTLAGTPDTYPAGNYRYE